MNELRHDHGRRPIFGHIGLICCIACLGSRAAYPADPPVYEIKPKKVIEVNRDPKWLAFSNDGKRLAASEGTRAWVWDTATGEKILESARDGRCEGGRVALSPDGSRLIVATAQIRLLDVESGEVLKVIKGTVNQVTAVFSPDGKTFASTASRLDGVKLWEACAGKDLERFQLAIDRPLEGALSFSPDGKMLAVATEKFGYTGGEVHLLDVASGTKVRRLAPKRSDGERPKAICFSPDSRFVALAQGLSNEIAIWEVETGKLVWELSWTSAGPKNPEDRAGVSCVAFGANSRCLIAACADDRMRAWEVATGKERYQVVAHSNSIVTAREGRLAAAVVDARGWREIVLWDTRTVGPARPTEFPDPDKVWTDLGAEDSAQGYRAMRELAAFPKDAVALLEKRLADFAPARSGEIERCIRDLDDDSFEARARAKQRLSDLGAAARSALISARSRSASAEVKKSIDELLEGLLVVRDARRLRLVRAIELLEAIDTTESGRLLEDLSVQGGEPDRKTPKEPSRP